MTDPADRTPYEPNSAKRIGGKDAPRGRAATGGLSSALKLDTMGKTRLRFRKRGWFVLAAATPLLLAGLIDLFGGDPFGLALNFGLFGLFAFAVYLIRQGGEAEDAYLERKFASPPAIPRKLLGSVVLGGALLGTGLFGWGLGVIESVALGVVGAVSGVLTFGMDPMREKGEISIGGITHGMVTEAIAEAEEKIESIERAAADVHDRPLRERLADVTKSARRILTRIEEDPSDLRRARKFMKVYLDGALDATRKYVKNQNEHAESEMYMKFRALLDDMKTTFDAQHEKLLTNDRIDLDVEIDVLADRLRQETAL